MKAEKFLLFAFIAVAAASVMIAPEVVAGYFDPGALALYTIALGAGGGFAGHTHFGARLNLQRGQRELRRLGRRFADAR